ncbi:hypothetical protein CY34DRAFT_83942 [Suillus luteus UH-Slu-Lm8-n1]|uniref:Cytochrome P450 n=1 Tax=Suillus luteus UH-Slu-Lm8-n1 TaxID=930992 RepID=A0A0D0B6U1_9AGAM|nr:hypothetical protein CY34DRAFT_83942 [Suillus luteus UH-Slu-Lm8-n1]
MVQLFDLPISDNTQLVLGAAVCIGLVGVINWTYFPSSKRGLLPPSPPTWRLLGHFLPLRYSFLTIAGWIDEYGPLITIRSGTKKIIIIGRHKAAVEIMERQGGLLSDRPRMIAAGEILSGGQSIGFINGDKLRRMRRVLHTHLQPKAAEAYQPLQMSHAKHTVLDILNDPHNFHTHAVTYSAATILKIAYGKNTPTSATDPEVRDVRHLMKYFRIVLHPGAYLVESIPWLKYLPWYGQDLKQQFKKSRELYLNQLNHVRQQLQSDVDAGPSFARYMLEHDHLGYLTETEKAFLAGGLFGAASDSTAVAICTVLIAAACFPEEQAKVQAEIDTVIGRHRAPTFADQQSLPYLEAFILEAMRWRPLATNVLQTIHRPKVDLTHWQENYHIPAGTTVYGNHWSISRDPEVYPDPDAFKPQRWINDEGHIRDDLKFFVFGFGRRVCPGLHIANRSMFINSLLIFWAFQLILDPTKPLDDWSFMNQLIPSDRPCVIDFKTRFPEVELRHMMESYPDSG